MKASIDIELCWWCCVGCEVLGVNGFSCSLTEACIMHRQSPARTRTDNPRGEVGKQ